MREGYVKQNFEKYARAYLKLLFYFTVYL